LDPDHVHGRLLSVDMALDDEDGAAALTHLTPLLAAADDVAAVHNRHGLALELSGDEEGAVGAYLAAIQRDERAHDAWINLGRLHRRRGAHAEALRAFDRAVAAAGTNGAAHLGRGLARAANGDIQGAQTDFARAAEL